MFLNKTPNLNAKIVPLIKIQFRKRKNKKRVFLLCVPVWAGNIWSEKTMLKRLSERNTINRQDNLIFLSFILYLLLHTWDRTLILLFLLKLQRISWFISLPQRISADQTEVEEGRSKLMVFNAISPLKIGHVIHQSCINTSSKSDARAGCCRVPCLQWGLGSNGLEVRPRKRWAQHAIVPNEKHNHHYKP